MFGIVTHQIFSEPDARIEAGSYVLVNTFPLSHNSLNLSGEGIQTRHKSREDVTGEIDVIVLLRV